jgi:hypothetical protein
MIFIKIYTFSEKMYLIIISSTVVIIPNSVKLLNSEKTIHIFNIFNIQLIFSSFLS